MFEPVKIYILTVTNGFLTNFKYQIFTEIFNFTTVNFMLNALGQLITW